MFATGNLSYFGWESLPGSPRPCGTLVEKAPDCHCRLWWVAAVVEVLRNRWGYIAGRQHRSLLLFHLGWFVLPFKA